jgi:hypothetical protein
MFVVGRFAPSSSPVVTTIDHLQEQLDIRRETPRQQVNDVGPAGLDPLKPVTDRLDMDRRFAA